MSKLIVGCGYLGRRVAQRWLAQGETVYAVARTRARADEFRALGIEPIVSDLTQPDWLAGLPRAESVVFAVGLDRAGGPSRQNAHLEALRNVLAALPDSVRRLIYISSTGVYGQQDGSWVDERSPCAPRRAGGKVCLAAEQLLAQHRLGERANVLRLAGIYGPGRVPSRAKLAAGNPIAAASRGYVNLIHVEDAAEVVAIVDRTAPAGRLYLVADGAPVLRRQYYREIVQLFGIGQARFDEPVGDSPQALRARTSKRVSNRRLVEELHVTLRYPSYREGLRAIVQAERESD